MLTFPSPDYVEVWFFIYTPTATPFVAPWDSCSDWRTIAVMNVSPNPFFIRFHRKKGQKSAACSDASSVHGAALPLYQLLYRNLSLNRTIRMQLSALLEFVLRTVSHPPNRHMKLTNRHSDCLIFGSNTKQPILRLLSRIVTTGKSKRSDSQTSY